MVKILFIQHGAGFGGATKSLLLMQKELSKHYKLYTISQILSKKTKSLLIKMLQQSAEFIEYEFPSIKSSASGSITNKKFYKNTKYFPYEIINFILVHNIKIVHINSSLFSHLLKPIKESTNAKVVVHLREMLPNNQSEISQYILNNHNKYADKIIAISDNEIKYYPISEKIVVIPNPHDFCETDPFLETKLEKNKIVIGMCANFIPIKGHIVFLKMANIINNNISNNKKVEFRIIGYPLDTNTLKDLLKKITNYGYKNEFDRNLKRLKINNIKIIPFTYNIYEEISNWHIYIRPDLSGNPWGRDIIEAMALKKAIVATGSSEFYIENGVNGYLIPPSNPFAMAEKVIELINNHEKRKVFGEAGYKKIYKMCDIIEYGRKINNIYSELFS